MKPPHYPIYVISKGRYDQCLTARFLVRDSVPFHLVVEPQEQGQYLQHFNSEQILVLPFSNLGQGSIPARNWVWQHALEQGHERHWILDDNIAGVNRRYKAKRVPCNSAFAFFAIEEFTDRYENIAISGMNYDMFVPTRAKAPPFVRNVHVYSNLLILNSLPQRWRGRYNEDVDLCLQVLADGWCTVLFNAFVAKKMATMRMKGGNTDELYKGQGRLAMARSLQRMWPHVVDVKRRFNRPQHVVHDSWKQFKTPLKRRKDIDWDNLPQTEEFGMVLKKVRPIKSKRVQRLLEENQKARKGT